MNTNVFPGAGRISYNPNSQSTQHEAWPWTLIHEIPQSLEDTLAAWVKITLTLVRSETFFIRQGNGIVQTNFGRSLWIDGARCVPSTFAEWLPSVSGPCDSCSWKKCLRFTMNVMPNGKRVEGGDGLAGRTGPRDTSWSLVEAREHVLLEGNLSSVSAPIRSFFLPEPSLSGDSWKDSHSYLWAQNLSLALFNGVLVRRLYSGAQMCVRLDLLAWFLPLPWARSLETWW